VTSEKISAAVAHIGRRSAIHFVVTSVTPAIESEIKKLIAAKLVVLHVPPGARVNFDCAVHNFPVS
jgi:hypothetical protein